MLLKALVVYCEKGTTILAGIRLASDAALEGGIRRIDAHLQAGNGRGPRLRAA